MLAAMIRILVAFVVWILASAMFHSIIISAIVLFAGAMYIVMGGAKSGKEI